MSERTAKAPARAGVAVAVLCAVLGAVACSGSSPAAVPSTGPTSSTAAEASTSPASTAPTASATTTIVPDPDFSPGSHGVTFMVDGVARTAVVVVPADTSKPAPLVFAFHGHGGNGHAFQRRMHIETLWPEAVVVYPDGLAGHKGITDPDGTQPGWQTVVGGERDRDLHLYDTMRSTIEAHVPIDEDRVYVMGHSNGSQFAGLLLNQRGDRLAASANLSSTPNAELATDPVRSMFFSMGIHDPLVPIDHQRVAIPLAERHLGIDTSTAAQQGDVTSEHAPAPSAIELEYVVYDGGHEPPDEIPGLVVAFFQRHTRSGG